MEPNELFQYSIISALMDGVASKGITLSTLLERGNHGLGTFKNIMGEMILLDGKIYQMMPDGTVTKRASYDELNSTSPFAMVTSFQAEMTVPNNISSKKALSDEISRLLPNAKNHFIASRIEGEFKRIIVRNVGGQEAHHQPLAEVCESQKVYEFGAARGTIVGFRCPQYIANMSAVGDHLHFLTDDRKHGGHVVELESNGDVDIAVSRLSRLYLQLPDDDEDFDAAPLISTTESIASVEE